jgi:DNA repair protein RecN (Recombination protein N)
MLAIKTTLADRQPTPVMVFDEIDTGVGGVTANRVGEKLRSLSKRSQVFCVTHLAQIASLATGHYTVSKSANDDATAVVVKKLDYQGRVAELGRMVGDDVGSDAALKWAEQALKAATEPLPAS